MVLPADGTRWPPPGWAPAFNRYRFNEAIWLNDTLALASLFGANDGRRDDLGRLIGSATDRRFSGIDTSRRWNWGRYTPATEKRTDLPIPIGRSVADLSAAQLMAEPPLFRVVERDEKTGRAKTKKGLEQDRLDLLTGSDDARMTLLEGAQTVAAIGGGVLKAQWDLGDPDRESAWFDVIGADCAIPEFNGTGRLIAVMLWTEYDAPGSRIYRHVERHAGGVIEHGLYIGTQQGLGKQIKLDTIPSGEAIQAMIVDTPTAGRLDGMTGELATGVKTLTAQFWRNRPATAWRRLGQLANLGRSDFEGIEPVLDAYSEAWGSMMRDVRLGKARLLVPQGMLEMIATKPGGGSIFDPDRELYQEVGGLDPESSTNSLKDWQPMIRWQEHLGTLTGLKQEILDGSGWSLSSYGNTGGVGVNRGAATATEVVDRTTKSERTRDEKALYFASPGNRFFRTLMELDGLLYHGKGGGPVPELSIDFPDVSQVDPDKQAAQFMSLRSVNAISIEETVRERRPNWDDDEVDAEVARILLDIDRVRGGAMADPTQVGQINLADPAAADPTADPTAPKPVTAQDAAADAQPTPPADEKPAPSKPAK